MKCYTYNGVSLTDWPSRGCIFNRIPWTRQHTFYNTVLLFTHMKIYCDVEVKIKNLKKKNMLGI